MQKVGVLQESELFAMLSGDELEMLSTLTLAKDFEAGEDVFKEGDEGDGLYIIVSGSVDVLRAEGGEQKVLATLDAPQFFGEMAVIDKELRSATVRANEDSRLLFISVANLLAFRRVFRDGFMFVVINIARVLSGRLRDTNGKLATRL